MVSFHPEFAADVRKQVAEFDKQLEDAKNTIAFREGPVAAISEGLRLTETAGELADPDKKKAYSSALDHFRRCRKDGATIIADHPRLASAQFVIAKKKTKGASVLMICGDYAKSAEAKLLSTSGR